MKKAFFYFILISFSCLLFQAKCFADEEILILFDSSVSMMDKINNEPKYIVAARAAKDVLSKTSGQTRIGMRIIGMQLNDNILTYIQHPERLCKATELVNPIKVNNINNISESLDALVPLGTTPLTYSLALAIDHDFNRDTKIKHIILISDGAESCNQDPCKYIREITTYRKDVKIDIIAINVNGDEFSQLKCIADASGGTITPVKSEPEISAAFETIINSYKTDLNTSYSIKQKTEKIRFKNYMFEVFN